MISFDSISSNFFVACQSFHSLNDDTTILSGPDPIKIMQTNLAEVQEELTKFE